MLELEAVFPKAAVTISFAVRPDEIELAFATNGESLRHRMLLALVAALATNRSLSPAVSKKRRRVA